jgi:hypothetical protein
MEAVRMSCAGLFRRPTLPAFAPCREGKKRGARRYYERFGFNPAPTDPFHPFVLMKDCEESPADNQYA